MHLPVNSAAYSGLLAVVAQLDHVRSTAPAPGARWPAATAVTQPSYRARAKALAGRLASVDGTVPVVTAIARLPG